MRHRRVNGSKREGLGDTAPMLGTKGRGSQKERGWLPKGRNKKEAQSKRRVIENKTL